MHKHSETERYHDFCDEKCFNTWGRDYELPEIHKRIAELEKHVQEASNFLKRLDNKDKLYPFISLSQRLSIVDLVFNKACVSRKNVQKAKNLVIKERHNMFNFCDENREQEWMHDSTLMTYSELLTEKSLSTINVTASIFT